MKTNTTKTSQMQIRIDPSLKLEAESVLSQIGLSSTEFVRMALKQLVMQKGLPFEAKIPNAETIAAFNEDPSTLKSYTNVKEMMKDLLSDAD